MKSRTRHDGERPDRPSTSTDGRYVMIVRDPMLKIRLPASIQVIWVLSAFKINAPSRFAVALRSCSTPNPAEVYSSWRLMRQLGILNNTYHKLLFGYLLTESFIHIRPFVTITHYRNNATPSGKVFTFMNIIVYITDDDFVVMKTKYNYIN
uniref:Uncharacterized protein n=1 Tax=Glossina pallidipes TaxID=7398 RepID=A0A1A9Z5P8_GLOPL